HLERWGHDVEVFPDGQEALNAVRSAGGSRLAILDWMMPSLDGPEICRRLRIDDSILQPYIILLTSREGAQSTVEGLKAGADDYVLKPF
ncbi:MAG TPA: diguanylate cyclase response regulator, partial [Verrucomicrobiales bacterium]|nr:diguanylate cyclase response regulator [Verrucomicrobiales bacterium]